jgi:hypothetical protein
MKPKGKPKTPPNTEEQQTIVTLAAGGVSPNKIARTIGRSRHLVRNTLARPEIQRSIQDEKAELSALCKDKGRAIILSIDDDVIAKGNLLQRATSGAILIDKALLLAGEALPIVNISVLMQVVEAIRSRPLMSAKQPALPPPEPEE